MAAHLFQPIPAYPRTEKVLQPTPAAFIAFRINVFSQTFSGRCRPCRCTPAALRHRRCLDTWVAKCALPIRARQAGQHALPSPKRCARMVSQECCRGQFSRACSRPGNGPLFLLPSGPGAESGRQRGSGLKIRGADSPIAPPGRLDLPGGACDRSDIDCSQWLTREAERRVHSDFPYFFHIRQNMRVDERGPASFVRQRVAIQLPFSLPCCCVPWPLSDGMVTPRSRARCCISVRCCSR